MGYIGNVNIELRVGRTEYEALAGFVEPEEGEEEPVLNIDRINQAIDYASGVFDAYIPLTYRRPLVATPLVLSLNLDLAVYDLWKDKAEWDEGKWKVRKAAHDDALRILKSISQGQAELDSPKVISEDGTVSGDDLNVGVGTQFLQATPTWPH